MSATTRKALSRSFPYAMCSKTETMPRIPALFAGKNVFITGASGFLGKVLVEKLLRSCPDLGDVYVLLRPKKGKTPEERLKEITDLPLFDRLRETHPSSFSKLKLITGDTTQLGLGLSPSDRRLLAEHVNIVYHTAASVRFDDSLRAAILLNTRGTRETVLLAQEMGHLDMFVHVSTTYCNTDRAVVEERVYPPQADWRTAIRIAEEMDERTLEVLTAKYLGEQPNTYTFTKHLAEHVVYDLCEGRMPAMVIRPSVVISSLDEPMPGWVDNFNGVIGMITGVGKGLIHTIYSQLNFKLNYIPVDVCIKGIIVATWYEIIKSNNLQDGNHVEVYNACSSELFSMTTEELVHIGLGLLRDKEAFTIGPQVWYPITTVTNNKYKFYVQYLFFQLLPALILDGLIKLTRGKPFLYKIQKRIYIAFIALEYFSFNNWTFINDKFMSLNDKILEEDVADFLFFHEHVHMYDYYERSMKGGAKYLLNANVDDDKQRRMQRRLKYLHYFVVYSFYALICWFIFSHVDDIANIAVGYYEQIFQE